ncbi:MAG: glycosyltransferase family 39 protein [Waddliaceae bacterium]
MSNLKILTVVLLLKAAFILGFIHFGGIGLAPDEAQYWLWSKNLDWGYYSKPVGVALEICFGCALFGDTELGIRFGAVLLSTLQGFAVYYLGRQCQLSPRLSTLAAIILTLSPVGIWGSFMATTDGGMVLFWTLAMATVAKAYSENRPIDGRSLGIFICFGALFKWTIFLFWPLLLLFRPKVNDFWKGALLSGIGLLPSLIWNIQHGFPTFLHVWNQSTGGPTTQIGFGAGNFFDFIGAQALLFTPIFFIAFLIGLFSIKKAPPALQFTGLFSFALLFLFSVLALFQKIQGNWAVFAFSGAAVFVAYQLVEKRAWGYVGIAVSVLFSTALLVLPIPYRANPFRHQLGWDRLESILDDAGYRPEEEFLFADKYQIASIASFYSQGKNRAYFLNLHGARENQFCYWPGLADEQLGKSGYFLLIENALPKSELEEKCESYYQELIPFFNQVELITVRDLLKNNKNIVVFKCFEYNGLVLKNNKQF